MFKQQFEAESVCVCECETSARSRRALSVGVDFKLLRERVYRQWVVVVHECK